MPPLILFEDVFAVGAALVATAMLGAALYLVVIAVIGSIVAQGGSGVGDRDET